MSWHILHTPMERVRYRPDGEIRWCFVCRKRRQFAHAVYRTVLNPLLTLDSQPGAYYGPTHQIECATCKTVDSDLFPGGLIERIWG